MQIAFNPVKTGFQSVKKVSEELAFLVQ